MLVGRCRDRKCQVKSLSLATGEMKEYDGLLTSCVEFMNASVA